MTNIIKFNSKEALTADQKSKKIILKTYLSPGDIVTLTAAVRDLKKAHGDKYLIDVDTSVKEIWENNPYLTPLDKNDPNVEVINVEYPLIHRSNTSPYHFIHGYRIFLEEKLGIQIPATDFKGDIHISDLEKSWISQIEEMGIKENYWILNAGGKYDYTAKWWNPDSYQKVIDHFKGKITFVQIGENDHFHTKLNNCIDLVGKTDFRQLIRLIYHSIGVLSPVTAVMHLAAAIETKHSPPQNRAAVIIAGGREPSQWESYPHHQFLHTNGALDCCDNGGCWKSRCSLVEDGDEKDKNLCIYPVDLNKTYHVNGKSIKFRESKCLNMITPSKVISAIETYYDGGILKYNK